MAVSRDQLAEAVAGVLFLKLSQQEKQKLFKDVGSKVDWESVKAFTKQAVCSVEAARTLSSHFVKHLSVLNAALEPQMFLGDMQLCTADLACHVALHAALSAFDDAHKWALCNVSRWFESRQSAAG